MTSVNSKQLMKLPKCNVSQELQEYDDEELNYYETFNEKIKK